MAIKLSARKQSKRIHRPVSSSGALSPNEFHQFLKAEKNDRIFQSGLGALWKKFSTGTFEEEKKILFKGSGSPLLI